MGVVSASGEGVTVKHPIAGHAGLWQVLGYELKHCILGGLHHLLVPEPLDLMALRRI